MRASWGTGPDVVIGRRYGKIGTGTAAVAASAAVQQPVATSTRSARMSPPAVRTPVTRSPSRRIESTAMPSRNNAPPSCAAAANPASAASGVAVPVARAEPAAEDIVRADPGNELRDLDTIHHADRSAHALVEGHRLAELRDTLLRVRDEQVAALLEIMPRAGAVFKVAPKRRRQLGHANVELVDKLMTDAPESALRRAGAELVALDDEDVALAAVAEEERGGGSHDATPDDDRRRSAREIGQPATSSNRNLPSASEMRPNRGRSWVKPTIHRSSIARRRISFFAASVSSGKRSNAGIQGSGRWWRSGMKSLEKKSVVSRSVMRTVWVPRVWPCTRSRRTPGSISTDSSISSSLPAASRGA